MSVWFWSKRKINKSFNISIEFASKSAIEKKVPKEEELNDIKNLLLTYLKQSSTLFVALLYFSKW